MASFSGSFSSITETSAKFSARFSGGQATFAGYRYCRLFVDGTTYEIRSSSKGGASSSFSKTISGLKQDTTYSWAARLGYEEGSKIVWLDNVTDSGSFTTERAKPDIDPWSWTRSNGYASSRQTRDAYSAASDSGTTDEFSYLVWNDLVDKVDEVLDGYDLSWNSRYASLSGTKLNSSGSILTATRFNSVVYNLTRMVTFRTWLPYVSKGDIVYGSYFLNIAEEINHAIDDL